MAEAIVIRGAPQLLRRLERLQNVVGVSGAREIATTGAEALRTWMIDRYITGQRVKVDTGKFRSSWGVSSLIGNQGASAVLGTNTKYAPILEFGFQGTQNVKEYTRKVPIHRRAKESLRSVRRRRNKPGRPIETVRAHTRSYPGKPPNNKGFQPRRYLRDTLIFGEGYAVRQVESKFRRMFEGA